MGCWGPRGIGTPREDEDGWVLPESFHRGGPLEVWKHHEKPNHHLSSGNRAVNLQGCSVDGSEILRSPVEVGSWNPIIYKVLETSQRWLGMGFLNHQQYPLPTNAFDEFPEGCLPTLSY